MSESMSVHSLPRDSAFATDMTELSTKAKVVFALGAFCQSKPRM